MTRSIEYSKTRACRGRLDGVVSAWEGACVSASSGQEPPAIRPTDGSDPALVGSTDTNEGSHHFVSRAGVDSLNPRRMCRCHSIYRLVRGT